MHNPSETKPNLLLMALSEMTERSARRRHRSSHRERIEWNRAYHAAAHKANPQRKDWGPEREMQRAFLGLAAKTKNEQRRCR